MKRKINGKNNINYRKLLWNTWAGNAAADSRRQKPSRWIDCAGSALPRIAFPRPRPSIRLFDTAAFPHSGAEFRAEKKLFPEIPDAGGGREGGGKTGRKNPESLLHILARDVIWKFLNGETTRPGRCHVFFCFIIRQLYEMKPEKENFIKRKWSLELFNDRFPGNSKFSTIIFRASVLRLNLKGDIPGAVPGILRSDDPSSLLFFRPPPRNYLWTNRPAISSRCNSFAVFALFITVV